MRSRRRSEPGRLRLRGAAVIGLLAASVLGTAMPCAAQRRQNKKNGTSVAERVGRLTAWFAPKVRQRAPDWAQTERPPLFTFAWISDLHLDASRLEFIAKALGYIDRELKPDFVMITGDNNAHPAPVTDPQRPEPLALRRQKFFRTYLDKHLKTPCVIMPGDNWPHDFEKVFGPAQYSFDYGGLHFLFTSPDREPAARGRKAWRSSTRRPGIGCARTWRKTATSRSSWPCTNRSFHPPFSTRSGKRRQGLGIGD